MTDGPRTYPPTAHIPLAECGVTCRTCTHFVKAQRKKGRCLKWAKFMGLDYLFTPEMQERDPDWWRGLKTISRDTPGCKYHAPVAP